MEYLAQEVFRLQHGICKGFFNNIVSCKPADNIWCTARIRWFEIGCVMQQQILCNEIDIQQPAGDIFNVPWVFGAEFACDTLTQIYYMIAQLVSVAVMQDGIGN